MIHCPGCAHLRLSVSDSCPECGLAVSHEGPIALLSPQTDAAASDYDPVRLDRLRRVEATHPWFVYRRDLIRRLFRRYVRTDAHVLDIGAGTGATAAALRQDGFEDLAVADIHVQGLRYAASQGLGPLYQLDLMRPSFSDEFDLVSMFDVLEHFADPVRVLGNVVSMLRPGGLLIATVPAYMALWSAHDVAAGHHRRYNRGTLRADLSAAGLSVRDCRYFLAHTLPFMLLRRLMHPAPVIGSTVDTLGDDDQRAGFELPALVTRVVEAVSVVDRCLLMLGGPMGGSLYVVAQRPE